MSTIRNKLFGLSTAPVSKPIISKPSGNMAILPKMAQPVETLPKNNSAKPTAASVSGTSSTHIPISILNGNREQVPQQNRVQGSNFSGDARIPISIVNGDREQVSQQNRIQVSNASTGAHIPISIVNGNRDMTFHLSTSENDGADSGQKPSNSQTPYMPISGETVSKDITTVSPQMSAYLQQGSPSAAVAIPKEYADLANLLDKASSDIDFNNWADLTAKQQLSIAQKAGLSVKDKQTLLNASPQYVETIAKVQDIFANRYELGLTIADTRTIAKKLFNIADEKDEATNRTGKYANDAVFAPRALRYLDEQEDKLLAGIGMSTNDTGRSTWYNGKNSGTAAKQVGATKNAESGDYIQAPGQTAFGPKSNSPAVNCYGYILMNLGIEPRDGNYDIQPGQLSESISGDHVLDNGQDGPAEYYLEAVTAYTIRDVERSGRSVRIISSTEDANENEQILALKISDPKIFGMRDYHFAILLPDGTWADKPGTRSDSRHGAIEDPDGQWGEWWRSYNSATIYLAVSEQ